MKKKKTEFSKWLAEKNMSKENFAFSLNQAAGFAVVKARTVASWANVGSKPRDAYLPIIRNVYPDCPLLS